MKRIIILSIVFLYSCTQNNAKQINKVSVKKELDSILTGFHQAATDANFEKYFNTLDSTSTYIGTAAEEIWTKKQFAAYSKPHFDKGKAWDFKTLSRTIYLDKSEKFAWFDELLATWMGTCRGSGVLEKQNNSWKIKHYVLSVVIPNDDIYKVMDAKQKNDSIFLKSLMYKK